MIQQTIFVISDLHLGGASPAFQMCSSQGRARLVQFIRWVATEHSPGHPVRLVLNGDIVDFLAEKDAEGEWAAFTADEKAACYKFERILQQSEPVWNALADAGDAGVELTLLWEIMT